MGVVVLLHGLGQIKGVILQLVSYHVHKVPLISQSGPEALNIVSTSLQVFASGHVALLVYLLQLQEPPLQKYESLFCWLTCPCCGLPAAPQEEKD